MPLISGGGGGGGLPDPVPAPLDVAVTADNTDGVFVDASDAALADAGDALLVAVGDPDRLNTGHALRVTGKNGAVAALLDGYGNFFLQDSTASAANAVQVGLFSPRPLAYGARAQPDGQGNTLAAFMSGGSILTACHAAPADGDLTAGDCAIWFDQTNGASKLMVKAKSADGTVVTGSVNLA